MSNSTIEPLTTERIEHIRALYATHPECTIKQLLATLDARGKTIADVNELLGEQSRTLAMIRVDIPARVEEATDAAVRRSLAERDAEIARLRDAVLAEREACAALATAVYMKTGQSVCRDLAASIRGQR